MPLRTRGTNNIDAKSSIGQANNRKGSGPAKAAGKGRNHEWPMLALDLNDRVASVGTRRIASVRSAQKLGLLTAI